MSKSTGSLCQFWHSSIGKKIIVALTGIILVGFLLGHLTGNLLVFAGKSAFNEYAAFLHGMLHGAGIWIARLVLLGSITLHIAATICLVRQNRIAKGVVYEKDATVKATNSSKIMIWSGLTILAFVIYHILHFTTRSTSAKLKELGDSGDAHGMVIEGFKSFPVTLFYIVAVSLLCSHLSHGISSIFQTLGLRSRNNACLICGISKGITAIILIGFLSIPIAICFFGFKG